MGERFLQKLGRIALRECGVVFARHCEEQRDEAIHSFLARRDGLLRGACHRARIRATRWLAMAVSELAV
jgi:hypothetical protein